ALNGIDFNGICLELVQNVPELNDGFPSLGVSSLNAVLDLSLCPGNPFLKNFRGTSLESGFNRQLAFEWSVLSRDTGLRPLHTLRHRELLELGQLGVKPGVCAFDEIMQPWANFVVCRFWNRTRGFDRSGAGESYCVAKGVSERYAIRAGFAAHICRFGL